MPAFFYSEVGRGDQTVLEQNPPLRIAVLGISGAGKSRFAGLLSKATGMARIELDTICWRANWYDRYHKEFNAFRADVEAEISQESWVLAGGYTKIRPLILARATTVVVLELPKWRVLQQVLVRSLHRAITRTPIHNGNRESVRRWFSRGHPIQIVLRNYRRKYAEFARTLDHPENAHLTILHCRSRQDVDAALRQLTAAASRQV